MSIDSTLCSDLLLRRLGWLHRHFPGQTDNVSRSTNCADPPARSTNLHSCLPDLTPGEPAVRCVDTVAGIAHSAFVRFGRLAFAVVVALSAGCGETDCTAVGCSTGILVDSSHVFAIEDLPLSVTVCIDQLCHTQRIDATDIDAGQRLVRVYSMVDFDAERERDVAVTLEVRSEHTGEILADADGMAHVKRLQPNGASCGPTCYFSHMTYDGTDNLIVT